jgi:hypothetical protein
VHPGLGHLAGHDRPADARVLEAADHPAEAGDAGPVEAVDQPGQFRRRLVADADAHHRDAQPPRLLGEDDREPAAAGQQADRGRGRAGHGRSLVCF